MKHKSAEIPTMDVNGCRDSSLILQWGILMEISASGCHDTSQYRIVIGIQGFVMGQSHLIFNSPMGYFSGELVLANANIDTS